MSVQYVPAKTVEIVTPGTINVAEIEVYNIAGQNVARGASVDMSSVYPSNNKGDSRFGTRVANDGWLNSIDAKGEYHMIHTYKNSGSRWVRLTFPREESIGYIVVYNRASTDCCEQRLKGATVRALDSKNRVTYQTVVQTVENVYVFGPSASGKHYPLPSKGSTRRGKTGDNEENQFRQYISECFGQGGLYDGNTCPSTNTRFRIRGDTGEERIHILYSGATGMTHLVKDYLVSKAWQSVTVPGSPGTIKIHFTNDQVYTKNGKRFDRNVRVDRNSFTVNGKKVAVKMYLDTQTTKGGNGVFARRGVYTIELPTVTISPVTTPVPITTIPITTTPAPALPTTAAPLVTTTAPPIPTTAVPTTAVPMTTMPPIIPTTTPAPQPDEYIGKSLYIVRPLLKERYPDFEVLEVREDENLSSQVRPKTIIVRYRQLPIPPNVRAFPGSFTRVIDVSIPSTMAPVLPTAPLTTTPAPALPTTTAPAVTATAPPIPTTPVPTTTVPSTDTPMPPPPETTTPVPTCPPLTEDETILDGNTGSLYRVQSGALRMYPDIQVYRSWGSPQYRVFPSDAISACFKGLPMEPKPTPTSLPTQSPSTTMPPISIETPGPAIDPSMYVMIHADTYENDGKIHVLATRFGGLVLEPYRTREYNQVFLTGSGYIRSAAGQGEYLEHNEECRVPLLTISPDDDATWQMQNTGTHQYKYRVLSACGGLLRAESGKTTVDLGTDTPDGTTWYIVPVGTAESG